MTVDRSKLLDAAARVYGELGFRGATTRRIADEAGVNEITIFRQFGSKESLINQAIRAHAVGPRLPELPGVPVDPAVELGAWCSTVLAHLSGARSLIRRMMSETDERPGVAPCVGDGPTYAWRQLRAYVIRLDRRGLLGEPGAPASGSAAADGPARHGDADGVPESATDDQTAAVSMLISALFGDAMGREMMPDMYPQPAERAAAAYVALFLRALGAREQPTPAALSVDVQLR